MSRLGNLYHGRTSFNFVAQRKRWFIVSSVLLAISILALLILQLNLSVDFEGGVIVDAPNASNASVEDVRSAVAEMGQANARVQLTDEGEGILVQTEALVGSDQDLLVEAVAGAAGVPVDDTNLQAVGPTFGAEITRRAVQALVIFLIVVVIFISWRFEWKMSLAALAALGHDLLLTAGIYALVGFEVTPATVIAILTILGYSLYDTVVVFDKLTENVEDYGDRYTFTDIANRSMNEVLMRSINTSLTSLLPIGSLLFIGSLLLGAATLREFALALFIGVAAGTYSSIFVATPLLAAWKERETEWQRRQRRVDRKSGGPDSPEPESAVPVFESGATARPPKKRRR